RVPSMTQGFGMLPRLELPGVRVPFGPGLSGEERTLARRSLVAVPLLRQELRLPVVLDFLHFPPESPLLEHERCRLLLPPVAVHAANRVWVAFGAGPVGEHLVG